MALSALPWLSLLWTLPAAAGLVCWLLPPARARAAALLFSALILAYTLVLGALFAGEAGALRLVESYSPGTESAVRYFLALGPVGLSLVWLTALLLPVCVAAEWGLKRSGSYWAAFFFLESGLFGVFCAQNLFYFYAFWDLVLIPMFFIIGLWGSERRRFAALKFVLYTFVGSLALLVGIVALPMLHHRATGVWTWDIPALAASPVGQTAAGRWVFAAMAAGFAVKVPLWPLHSWLPEAHTEAPAAGSVMLAGVMLKMGVYGLLHVLVPVFPELSRVALPSLGLLGVVNILYGALCAMAQKDLKRLVAFTSISHLGFCVAGLFSLTQEGLAGCALQMINHGLSTGGLFLIVGILYARSHSRGVSDFGELARTAPRLSAFFALILLSSIGLPGLNGFVGEVLAVMGLAKASWPLAVGAAAGTVLAAAYGLPAYQRIVFAPPGPSSRAAQVSDLELHEGLALGTLSVLIIALGLYPGPLLRLLQPALAPWVMR